MEDGGRDALAVACHTCIPHPAAAGILVRGLNMWHCYKRNPRGKAWHPNLISDMCLAEGHDSADASWSLRVLLSEI